MKDINLEERIGLFMARKQAKNMKIEKYVDLNGFKTAYEPVGEL